MASVELRQLTKRYSDGALAVREIDVAIRDGEFLIVVGPSGSGKSTTLRMVAGLESITSGDVLVDGARVNDVPPGERNFAMVFQDYALYSHMTVRENMRFPLQMRKVPRDEVERRVADAAAALGLLEHLDRRPGRLSGGQRQRVAMGRAIVREPRVFLMDEPLSNLDAQLRAQVRGEIAGLQARLGTTTVYVTHDQVEATALGDRIIVLNAGVVQQIGTPLELHRRPANAFVAGFIGSPPMNLMPGHVVDGRLRLPFATVELPDSLLALVLSGSRLTIGLRPRDLHDRRCVADADVIRGVCFDAHVTSIEWLGGESLVSLAPLSSVGSSPDAGIVIALSAEDLRRGDRLQLWFDPEDLHIFDEVSGARLDPVGRPYAIS